jgi:hypothetical protein
MPWGGMRKFDKFRRIRKTAPAAKALKQGLRGGQIAVSC